MTDIIIQGIAGRMGQVLVELIGARQDCRVVAGVDTRSDGVTVPVYPTLQDVTQAADVVIDFSHPDATRAMLDVCADKGLPCVVCTTGLDDAVKQQMQRATEKTAVFYSANMSLGINLLAELVQRAQAALPGFDIEIIERHHHNKLDAPSGTALLLADAINDVADGRYHYVYDRHAVRQKRDENEIGIHAVRGGSIVGEHEVLFAGLDETVSLSHTAYSRDVFANGAIAAALYLAGKAPGLYSMKDLMKDV